MREMMGANYRPLLLLTAFAVAWQATTAVATAQGIVDVETFLGEVRVRAPFVRVYVGPEGTRVRAPFTRYRSRRYPYPYEIFEPAPETPPGAATVRVEIDSSVRVVVPAARPTVIRPEKDVSRTRSRRRGRPAAPPATSLGEAAPFPEKEKADPAPAPARGSPTAKRRGPTKPTAPGSAIPAPGAAADHAKSPPAARAPASGKPMPVPPAPAPLPTETSYLVIPLSAGDRIPDIRVMIEKVDAGQAKSVYKLTPMWHTEVPRFFQPIAGIHLLAMIHPYTGETVCVQVSLPPGRPRLKVDSNEVEFDYGRHEVEIKFKRDGRVRVKYYH